MTALLVCRSARSYLCLLSLVSQFELLLSRGIRLSGVLSASEASSESC